MAEELENILVHDLLWRTDQAYRSGYRYSLGTALQGLSDEEAIWLPPGGDRPILWLLLHLGGCKMLHMDHAFGPGEKNWQNLEWPAWRLQEALRWLDDAHRALRQQLLALSDDDLKVIRPTHWGERLSTQIIFNLSVQHDLYHAGEIRCIRSLWAGIGEGHR
jgi:hypothetical protein